MVYVASSVAETLLITLIVLPKKTQTIMNVTAIIRLQFVNDYFYPTDAISRRALEKEMRLERFPRKRFGWISPALVARGYALAITGYDARQEESVDYSSRGIKIGGMAKPMADPCVKCHLRDLCDSDDCGRKSFRLFTNK